MSINKTLKEQFKSHHEFDIGLTQALAYPSEQSVNAISFNLI